MNYLFLLSAAMALPLWAQMPDEPWNDALHERPWCGWVQQAGPAPGWTQANGLMHRDRLSAGFSASLTDCAAWMMARVPMGRSGPKPSGASHPLEVSAGLGWAWQRPQVLSRVTWGPWTLAAQPMGGRWSASWRQLQPSGWTLVAHLRQDLIAHQSEFIIGLERADLALYASSLGRWRAVVQRGSLRLTLGGGAVGYSALGFTSSKPPTNLSP